MRLKLISIAAIAAITPSALWAQDAVPDDSNTIAFDINQGVEDDDDWAIAAIQAQQQPAQPSVCRTQSDIITAGAAHRPRYDENGALIRAPAATCAPPPAAAPRAASADDDRLIVERESSGGCTEDQLRGTRTCTSSGSVTIGNSPEGNERARQMVDDLLNDMRRD